MRARRRKPDEAEVSMSPLIDCVFLLLIFFLVATMLRQQDKDINIALPESTSDVRLLPDEDQFVLGVDAEGAIYIEGKPSTVQLLHQRLGEVAAATPGRRIRLDADRDAPIERVVEVLNAVQFRRLNNVGIRTYDPSYNRS